MFDSLREEQGWLAGLKEGDEVFVQSGGWYESYESHRVVRLTKTRIMLENGSSFRREDGYSPGERRYTGPQIVRPTEERKEVMRRRRALDRVGTVKWKELPTATLLRVLEVIDADRKKPEPPT